MAEEAVPVLVLYRKPGCCLCEEAEPIVERAAAIAGLSVNKRSIVQDPDAFARYRYRIPVLTLDGLVIGEGRVDEAQVRRALAGAVRSRSRGTAPGNSA